jgi:hypothetical protein
MRELIAGLRILDDYTSATPFSKDGVILVQVNPEGRRWDKKVAPQDASKLEHLGWYFDPYEGWKYRFGRSD